MGGTSADSCTACPVGYMTESEGATNFASCLPGPVIVSWTFDKYNGELSVIFNTDIYPGSVDVTKLQFNMER